MGDPPKWAVELACKLWDEGAAMGGIRRGDEKAAYEFRCLIATTLANVRRESLADADTATLARWQRPCCAMTLRRVGDHIQALIDRDREPVAGIGTSSSESPEGITTCGIERSTEGMWGGAPPCDHRDTEPFDEGRVRCVGCGIKMADGDGR